MLKSIVVRLWLDISLEEKRNFKTSIIILGEYYILSYTVFNEIRSSTKSLATW